MAIDQMLRYKIPASITLAQGLLESGAGTSTLRGKQQSFRHQMRAGLEGPLRLTGR